MTELDPNKQVLDEDAILEAAGAAWLSIDRVSGRVSAIDENAATLLGVEAVAVLDWQWQDLLGGSAGADPALAPVIAAGVRCTLPPVMVRRPDGLLFIAGGLLIPCPGGQLAMTLRRLNDEVEDGLLEDLGSADTIAALGIEQGGVALGQGGADAVQGMMDVRSSLVDLLRARDMVGLPVGSALTVILRDTDIEGAQDVSRALLSHLRSTLQAPGEDSGGLQLYVGLAQVGSGRGETALDALLAANRALSQARHGSNRELIRVAQDEDAASVGARAVCANGVFSDNRPGLAQRRFLARLLDTLADRRDSEELPWAAVELLLRQEGISAVAIYRRRRDDVFDFVMGGVHGALPVRELSEDRMPQSFRDSRRRVDRDYLEQIHPIEQDRSDPQIQPLMVRDNVLGYLILETESAGAFRPDIAAMHALAEALSALKGWRENPATSMPRPAPVITPLETGIEGYVGDNMEGAVDQAMFLARLDVPIAIIGPRGTGKMYVARIIHQESGAPPDMLVDIDCREFHSRKQAEARIAQELREAEGKTLVFKSAHLMNADAQVKLARQISTRTLADVSPPQYLPRVKLIALFPDDLEKLVRWDRLTPQLASAFGGYPIHVPPIRDRRQAVLRWAHKILGQECALRERYVRGFTPDAEQAMLQHDWPGNISEMRRCIVDALEKTDKEWLSPVDLGIFKGINPDQTPIATEARPFLSMTAEETEPEDNYTPSAFEALDVALGEAVNNLLARNSIRPLGAWLEDEVVLAVCDRYGNDLRGAADFLHTRPRNISRWLPKIQSREEQRAGSNLWQEPRRLVRDWIREAPQLPEPPLQLIENVLMGHVLEQGQELSVADRARIMGVSVPTYHKRLQERREA
jgi:DNA-binding NtrC family response regulator